MTVDAALLELMPHTVSVERLLSVDAYNAPTYGTPVRYQARWERKTKRVQTIGGEEKVATAVTYLAEAPGISPLDRITLPDGSTPVILAVEGQADQDGGFYECVYT